ncbi:MAG: class I SAM-dependent methyltransferase [Minwuiales bacterium]|nr:class I SAM-dependent methyltransferase [Minwuiales bacterium]
MGTSDTATGQGDTYDRSLTHWSEAGRREMESFYVLATEDYRQLALSFDWAAWLKTHERRVGDRGLRLLDAACGSGKFPSALQQYGNLASARLKPIGYDLLDPSAFSLKECRSVLRPPFDPGQDHLCRLQDLDSASLGYDIIWATHALYALPPGDLRNGLKNFVDALASGGSGFIAHASADSHYLKFYDVYLNSRRHGAGTPYTSAEQIIDGLGSLGVACEIKGIDYTCRVPRDNVADVEGYLQRCLFDDTISVADMLADPALARYLDGCRDPDGWYFRQQVKMIFFTA